MFLEKELSEKLMGCFFDIRNRYGPNHREKFYHLVFAELLELRKINYINHPKINKYSLETGKLITYYIPDILAENKIIIEFKAKPFLSSDDIRQTIEYLKTTKYEILYIVNFGEKNFKPKRYIYTNDRKMFCNENYIN
ncbi:MAG: GxxExxY protein [Patescibacteria group bacterium]